MQSLIGTIGGYVGLFLGYSVLQVPNAIAALTKQLGKWYSDIKLRLQKRASSVATMTITNRFPRDASFVDVKEEIEYYHSPANYIQSAQEKTGNSISSIIERKMKQKLGGLKARINDNVACHDFCTKSEVNQKMLDVLDYIDKTKEAIVIQNQTWAENIIRSNKQR